MVVTFVQTARVPFEEILADARSKYVAAQAKTGAWSNGPDLMKALRAAQKRGVCSPQVADDVGAFRRLLGRPPGTDEDTHISPGAEEWNAVAAVLPAPLRDAMRAPAMGASTILDRTTILAIVALARSAWDDQFEAVLRLLRETSRDAETIDGWEQRRSAGRPFGWNEVPTEDLGDAQAARIESAIRAFELSNLFLYGLESAIAAGMDLLTTNMGGGVWIVPYDYRGLDGAIRSKNLDAAKNAVEATVAHEARMAGDDAAAKMGRLSPGAIICGAAPEGKKASLFEEEEQIGDYLADLFSWNLALEKNLGQHVEIEGAALERLAQALKRLGRGRFDAATITQQSPLGEPGGIDQLRATLRDKGTRTALKRAEAMARSASASKGKVLVFFLG